MTGFAPGRVRHKFKAIAKFSSVDVCCKATAMATTFVQSWRGLVRSGVSELGIFDRVGGLRIAEHLVDCVIDGLRGAIGRQRDAGG